MKCIGCSNGVAFGCKHCVSCLAAAKARAAERYRQIKLEGRCKSCPNKVGDKGIYCHECKLKRKDAWSIRKRRGLCVTCGKQPAANGLKCATCHESYLDTKHLKKSNRLANGLCAFCDRQRVGTQLCEEHYLKFTSKTHLGTTKRYAELGNLFTSQGGVCPYTKRKLTLGVDASIDHIIPKSREGSSDVPNLQWVYYQVNFMKQDMLHEEFIALVKEISAAA